MSIASYGLWGLVCRINLHCTDCGHIKFTVPSFLIFHFYFSSFQKQRKRIKLGTVILLQSQTKLLIGGNLWFLIGQSENRLSLKDHAMSGGQNTIFVLKVSVSPYEYLPAGRGDSLLRESGSSDKSLKLFSNKNRWK